ncbi:hypothetical protein [Nocardia testacea]|uniref:hypothetical protein n=1 Tax=Nocardia testacea TaxID=248551 RepID=UPI0012F699CF|nr:hypothetical protein [Nocardia testacea]
MNHEREKQQASCRLDSRFVQPGEDPTWHLHPDTIAAIAHCETACPISQVVDCARRALGAGQLATEPEITLPADGVIAAGIICRGDNSTVLALQAVIDRYGRGAQRIRLCAGCERRLIPAGETLGVNEAHLAARGLCKGCYSATDRSGQMAKVYQLRPEHCVDCSRPMVGPRDPVPEGHVRHASRGRCSGCQTKHRRARKTA